MFECNQTAVTDSRRLFWAHQPAARGEEIQCDQPCGIPGLRLEDGQISSANWIAGLALNMLMTDASREDTTCGYRPGAAGGHWSQSYIEDGEPVVGTGIQYIKSQGTTAELSALLRAHAVATMNRLVTRGLANSVDVESSYLGGLRFGLEIKIFGSVSGTVNVSVISRRSQNGWIWDDL